MGFLDRMKTSMSRAARIGDWFLIRDWFLSTSLPEARSFLENHLQLLDPESERILMLLAQQFMQSKGSSPEDIAKLIEVRDSNLTLLRRAIAAGKTRQAVRDAYIDKFGAWRVLEIPAWLAAFSETLFVGWYVLETEEQVPERTLNAKGNLVLLLENLIARLHGSPSLEPEILADLQLLQGRFLMEKDPTRAIGLFTEAARVFPQQRFPKRFAQIRKNLGISFYSRMEQNNGNNEEDVLGAIVCFEMALTYYTPEKYMKEWGMQTYCLAQCYYLFKDYDHTRQSLRAFMSIVPTSQFPELFQSAQKILRDLEESGQRQEDFMDILDLSLPEVTDMLRENREQEREEKQEKLRRFREMFA